MNSIYIPTDFIDVYLSYLTKLLQVSHKEMLPIYEFSTQYFEEQRQAKYAGKKNDEIFYNIKIF